MSDHSSNLSQTMTLTARPVSPSPANQTKPNLTILNM